MNYNYNINNSVSRCIVLTALLLLACVTVSSSGAVAIDPDERDISQLDGGVVYEGQEVRIDVSTADFNATPGDSVYLIQYTDRPQFDVEQVFTVENDNTIGVVNTTSLSLGETYGISNSTSEGQAVVDGEFSKIETSLDASWKDNTVDADTSSAVIDVQSDRTGSVPITISAGGLDYQQLSDLFGSEVTITENKSNIPFEELGYDPDEATVTDIKSDGYITLTNWQNSDGDIVANFATLAAVGEMPSPGDYTFELMIADTGVRDEATIEITEAKQGASFTENVYQSTAGDLAAMEFEVEDTDEVFVQISDEAAFRDVLYVKVQDTDEQVTIQMNTRLVGTDYKNLTGSDDVYQTDNVARLVSAYHDGPTAQTTGIAPFKQNNQTINGKSIFHTSSGQQTTYQGYLQDPDSNYLLRGESKADMLDSPLDPINYELEIAGIENVDGSESVFTAGDDDPTNLLEESTLTLNRPTVRDVSVYHLGESEATSSTDISTLTDGQSPAGGVSNGDRIVMEIDASGIFGAIAAGGPNRPTDVDRVSGRFDPELLVELSENGEESLILKLESVPPVGNDAPNKVNIGAGGTETVAIGDYGNEKIYIIVDTSGNDVLTKGLPASQTEFIAKFGYNGKEYDQGYKFKDNTPLGGAFSVKDTTVKFPYIQPGDEVSSNEKFNMGPAEMKFDDKYRQGIHMLPNNGVKLEGETNLPPDTDGLIEVRSREDKSYIRDAQFDVNGDEFSSEELDLSDFPVNTSARIIIKTDDAELEERDGEIVAEIGQRKTIGVERNGTDEEQETQNVTVEVPGDTTNQTQQESQQSGGDSDSNSQGQDTNGDTNQNGGDNSGTSNSDSDGGDGRFLGIGILPIFAVVAVFLLLGSVLAAVVA